MISALSSVDISPDLSRSVEDSKESTEVVGFALGVLGISDLPSEFRKEDVSLGSKKLRFFQGLSDGDENIASFPVKQLDQPADQPAERSTAKQPVDKQSVDKPAGQPTNQDQTCPAERSPRTTKTDLATESQPDKSNVHQPDTQVREPQDEQADEPSAKPKDMIPNKDAEGLAEKPTETPTNLPVDNVPDTTGPKAANKVGQTTGSNEVDLDTQKAGKKSELASPVPRTETVDDKTRGHSEGERDSHSPYVGEKEDPQPSKDPETSSHRASAIKLTTEEDCLKRRQNSQASLSGKVDPSLPSSGEQADLQDKRDSAEKKAERNLTNSSTKLPIQSKTSDPTAVSVELKESTKGSDKFEKKQGKMDMDMAEGSESVVPKVVSEEQDSGRGRAADHHGQSKHGGEHSKLPTTKSAPAISDGAQLTAISGPAESGTKISAVRNGSGEETRKTPKEKGEVGKTPNAKESEPPSPDKDSYMEQCSAVLRELTSKKAAEPLRKAADAKNLPGYTDLIKRPMDLSLVASNVENGILTSPVEFVRDMQLIFKNSMKYNEKGSTQHENSKVLLRDLKEATDPIVKRWKEAKTVKGSPELPGMNATGQPIPASSPSSSRYRLRRSKVVPELKLSEAAKQSSDVEEKPKKRARTEAQEQLDGEESHSDESEQESEKRPKKARKKGRATAKGGRKAKDRQSGGVTKANTTEAARGVRRSVRPRTR